MPPIARPGSDHEAVSAVATGYRGYERIVAPLIQRDPGAPGPGRKFAVRRGQEVHDAAVSREVPRGQLWHAVAVDSAGCLLDTP